ncbi:MAG: FAD-linked oxidase C-terminal domain-containing protein [Candidatus Krumholzibacteriia bacterium]
MPDQRGDAGARRRTPRARSRDWSGDAAQLGRVLAERVEGGVHFDQGTRALYAADASNYRMIPIGVVYPRSAGEIEATVAACRDFGAPVLSRGGGTSLAGQCCNVAVVMDMSRHLNRVLEIDPERRIARFEPGCVLDTLRSQADRHHLTFAPDPATHAWCTLGGMIGNNSCGVHSVMGGKTEENIHALKILTYDGQRMSVGPTDEDEFRRIIAEGGPRVEIYRQLALLRDRYADLIRTRYRDIPRRVSGFNLNQLLPENGFHVARALVGTEGTCVTILEGTGRLVHSPPFRSLVVMGYPDVFAAADDVMEILALGPLGLEGMDERLVSYNRRKGLNRRARRELPRGMGWLLAEFGGVTQEEADERGRAVQAALASRGPWPEVDLITDAGEQTEIWDLRESGLGATAHLEGQPPTWPGWEDAAVPPERTGAYLRDFRGLLDRYGYEGALYGHFGQGCIHVRIDFDLESRRGIETYLAFVDEASDLVDGYGGSFSGEHGDGVARGYLLERMYGPELVQAMREFKAIWDPQGKMNPGKVVDPDGPDENLRLGTEYRPWHPETHFRYPSDQGSFTSATLRCVGVGKCRRDSGGTMCPSYRVTRDEKHTTRGRAHLLFEMMRGDAVRGGWRDEEVKDSLHLCLSCKGCKDDCPVNVDLATYKAEFLSHYYHRRLRPRHAYAFGWIYWWARLASKAPALANFFTQTPGLRAAARLAAGVAPQRQIPRFAGSTFKSWFVSRGPRNADGPPVILWPDTFNNHFHPDTARAAVEVLEHAGYRCIVPEKSLCCGRPLYDHGMLNLAKKLLRQIYRELGPLIDQGVPVVGLEPSCASVFTDEGPMLFPDDLRARRLGKQTYTLAEFLAERVPGGYCPPPLRRRAIFHGHCHQKAIFATDSDRTILERLDAELEMLDSGCCGMAGSFGFEKGETYDVSVGAGELVLLPAVRQAPDDAILVADGFSCREQIRQQTDRRALHLAQVLRMAIEDGPEGPRGPFPELRGIRDDEF